MNKSRMCKISSRSRLFPIPFNMIVISRTRVSRMFRKISVTLKRGGKTLDCECDKYIEKER